MLSSILSRQSAVRTTSVIRQIILQRGGAAPPAAARASPVLFSTKAAPGKKAAASPPPPPPPSKKAAPTGAAAGASTPAQQLVELAKALPHMDCVRYTHKNRTWTYQHVHYYSEALAIGLMENGFQVGDVLLSYLPTHFSEQMVLQFACSKAGLVLYTFDPALATTDKTAAAQALSAALQHSKANILVSQEAGNDVNYISLVQSVIPELRVYDSTCGMPFVTPRFPHLRMCIHTGFDQDEKYGWLPLRQMVVPSDNLDSYVPPGTVGPTTPLVGQFQLDAKGIPTGVGPTLTNAQVLQGQVWPTVTSILHKQFHTVEGVGVIF